MLKGLGGLGDMAKMMKAAQEMQGKMAELQSELESIVVIGESGAGMVRARCTAKGELTGLDIDPSIFNPEEKEVRITSYNVCYTKLLRRRSGAGTGGRGSARGRGRMGSFRGRLRRTTCSRDWGSLATWPR